MQRKPIFQKWQISDLVLAILASGALISNVTYVLGYLGILAVRSVEVVDRATYLIILATTAVWILAESHSESPQDETQRPPRFRKSVWFTAILLLPLPTNLFVDDQQDVFDGLGLNTALVFLASLFALSKFGVPKLGKFLSASLAAALFSLAALVSLQPIWGLADQFHSTWVLNDLAAWIVDHPNPEGFVAQYSNLQGLPLLLTQGVVPASLQPALISGLASGYSLLFLFFLALTVRELSHKLGFGLGSLIVLAWLLASNPSSGLGSILSSTSTVSIRWFLPLASFYFLIRFFRKECQYRYLLISGGLSGLALTNNLDFGAVAITSSLVTLMISGRYPKDKRSTKLPVFAGAALAGSLFGGFLLGLRGGSLEGSLRIVSAFTSGNWVTPIPIFGLHFLLFPLFAFSAVHFTRLAQATAENRRFLGMAGVLFSLFGLGSLAYFVPVSSTSVQLQASFLALGLVGVLALEAGKTSQLDEQQRKHFRFADSDTSQIGLLSLATAVSLVVFHLPDVRSELVRVSPNTLSEFTSSYSGNAYLEHLDAALPEIENRSESALYLPLGNLASSLTGIISLSRVTDPREERLFKLGSPTCSELASFATVLAATEHDGTPSTLLGACKFVLHGRVGPIEIWHNPEQGRTANQEEGN